MDDDACEVCGEADTLVCEDCGGLFCAKHGGRIHGEKPCPDTIQGAHSMLGSRK